MINKAADRKDKDATRQYQSSKENYEKYDTDENFKAWAPRLKILSKVTRIRHVKK